MTGVVVCNGSIEDYSFHKNLLSGEELIICADGGATHLMRMGVRPHILLGDFDSISDGDLYYFRNSGVEILRFPVEKDMTDTELAIETAIDRGCSEIIIIGGTGTRLDHSLSNILMLKKLSDRGITGKIINERNEITVIKDRITLQRQADIKITLLPLSDKVEGVTTKGLRYPLKNATLEMGSTWGVSNEFASEEAEVTLSSGLLLVIKARD